MIRPVLSLALLLAGAVLPEVVQGEPKVFDYIIVGTGPAGCTVARELSSNPKTKVLLLEAGSDYDNSPEIYNPREWIDNYLFRWPKYLYQVSSTLARPQLVPPTNHVIEETS